MSIQIPDELQHEIETRIAGTEFESVEEYICFVIREIVEGDPVRGDNQNTEDADVEDRLRELGYLD